MPNIRQSHWKNLTVFLLLPRNMLPEAMCTGSCLNIRSSPISVSSLSMNFLCFPWSNTDLESPFCPVSFSADRPAVLCSAALRQVLAASSDLPIPPTASFLQPPGAFWNTPKISCWMTNAFFNAFYITFSYINITLSYIFIDFFSLKRYTKEED